MIDLIDIALPYAFTGIAGWMLLNLIAITWTTREIRDELRRENENETQPQR